MQMMLKTSYATFSFGVGCMEMFGRSYFVVAVIVEQILCGELPA